MFRKASREFARRHKGNGGGKSQDEVVVRLPTEFYSEQGVVVQLEKVMASLAIHGIKYERNLQPPKVSLKDAVDKIRKLNVDYDFEALKAEREE